MTGTIPMTATALDARLELAVGRAGRTFAVEARLSLERGVLVLFGPSGAGKSLTLRALAGLEKVRAGRVRLGEETLLDTDRGIDVPAHRRRIGYVPQASALFPFATVTQNVSFALPRSRRHAGDPEVARLMEELGIAHLAQARPDSLSGGEAQRVALARALAVSPRLLLLDEPFAAIDRKGRASLRRLLAETLHRRGVPAVLVTHDPEDARELGSWMIAMAGGRTVSSGPPAHVLAEVA